MQGNAHTVEPAAMKESSSGGQNTVESGKEKMAFWYALLGDPLKY